MKVLAGTLTEEDRAILVESNRTGRSVLVAAIRADVIYDQRGLTGPRQQMQLVGSVVTWTHEYFDVGGWSFTTRVPWTAAVKVWWRDEAPSVEDVDAILAEHYDSDRAIRQPEGGQ